MNSKYSCLRHTAKLKTYFPPFVMCYRNVFSEICRLSFIRKLCYQREKLSDQIKQFLEESTSRNVVLHILRGTSPVTIWIPSSITSFIPGPCFLPLSQPLSVPVPLLFLGVSIQYLTTHHQRISVLHFPFLFYYNQKRTLVSLWNDSYDQYVGFSMFIGICCTNQTSLQTMKGFSCSDQYLHAFCVTYRYRRPESL